MTFEEKKKILAALSAPFPESAIERTRGSVTGRGYDTVGIRYQFIANRMNEVLGLGSWRAHRTVMVKEITTARGRPAYEAICDITLELGEWIDGQFVCWAESLADGGHVAISEADARKGAYTNAFKKAAAFLGIGKQAYEGSIDDDSIPLQDDEIQQASPSASAPAAGKAPPAQPSPAPATGPRTAPTRNRLTSKQLSAIWAIGRKVGHDMPGLRAMIKERFKVQPEFLSREQASQVIDGLTRLSANGSGEHLHREVGAEG